MQLNLKLLVFSKGYTLVTDMELRLEEVNDRRDTITRNTR